MFDNFTATYHTSDKGFSDYDLLMEEKRLSLKKGLTFKGEEAYKFISSVLSLDKKNTDLCMKGIDEISDIKLSFSIGENYFSPEYLKMGKLEFGDIKTVSDFIYAIIDRVNYDNIAKEVYPAFSLSQEEKDDIRKELILFKEDEQAFLSMYPEYIQKNVNFFAYIVSSELADYLAENRYETGIPLYSTVPIWEGIENGIVKNSNVRDSLFPKFISSSSQINYGEYIVIAGLPSVNINNLDNMVVFTTTGPDEFLEKLDKHIKKLHLKVRDSGFSMCQCISDEYMRIFNEERNLKMECIPLADNPYKTGSTAYKCYGRAVFAAMDEMIKDDMRSLRGKISYNVDTRMFSKGIFIQTYIPAEKERIIISYFHEGRDYILSDFVHSASDGSLADKPLGDYFICDNPDVKRCIAATAEVMWKYEKTSYENLIDIMNGFFNKEAYDYNNGKEIFSIDSPETAIEKLKSIRIDRHGHLNYKKKYTMANYYRMIAVLKCPDETDINYINNVVIGEMVNDGVKEKHISEILKIMAEKACIPFNKNYIYSEIDKHIAFNKAKKQFNSKKLKQLKGERNG